MKMRMRDGTGIVELRYLVEDVDRHGNVRIYLRRGGKKTRLRETPGTPVFFEEYQTALKGADSQEPPRAAAAPGALRWLVERYYASGEFLGLNDSTKRARRSILDGLCERYGSKPYARMEPRHVRQLRDEKTGLPEAANGRVKALRQVFKWAKEAGHAERNPAAEVAYIRSGSDGFHTWTPDEVRRYEDCHPIGTKARLALALLLFTGVRRSDVVRLGPQMEADGWLNFTESKGRSRRTKVRELPILLELRAVIDATPSGHLNYLVTEFGKPFTPAGFGNKFRKWCDEAGLAHCSAHGLRKAGATIAANNGATEHQLMAIYGWESPKQAALYTRRADRRRLAGDAMRLVVPEQKMDTSVPLSEGIASGGTMKGKKP